MRWRFRLRSSMLLLLCLGASTHSAVAQSLDAAKVQVCAACHSLPPASLLPKNKWAAQVRQMVEIAGLRGVPISEAEASEIIAQYQLNAPAQWVVAPWKPTAQRTRLRFEQTDVAAISEHSAVSHVDIVSGAKPQIQLVDLGGGSVNLVSVTGELSRQLVRSRLAVRARRADLNADGLTDLVIAGLGWLYPTDNKLGSISIAWGQADGNFKLQKILKRLGRLSDVAVGDFDADGDLDLVAAEFGHNSGSILYLENQGVRFSVRKLLARSGPLQVIPADMNGDGRLDVVTGFAQEHEVITVLLNQGGGRFNTIDVHRAPHPAWGTNGVAVADMDADGDLDIVVSNGDSLDSDLRFRSWHGLTWLRQGEDFKFESIRVGSLYGAVSPVLSDLDQDGDVDIVCGSWFLGQEQKSGLEDPPGLVWFEQLSPTEWRSHALMESGSRVAAVAVGDLNNDSRPDVVAGFFRTPGAAPAPSARILLNARAE